MYAIDCYARPDWGGAPEHETRYEFGTVDDAERTFGGGAFVLPADLFTRPHQYGSERIVYTS
ncbi:hypothetical protein HS125_20730 [bacterium]|nr:hypothetical protein [bacterium]